MQLCNRNLIWINDVWVMDFFPQLLFFTWNSVGCPASACGKTSRTEGVSVSLEASLEFECQINIEIMSCAL